MEIVTSGYYKRPYQYMIPEVFHDQAKKRIDEMLTEKIIQPGSSPYSSPIVCVAKKNGSMRLCTDFRNSNAITITDRYVMPRVDEIKRRIAGYVLSTIDLKEGFNQVPKAKQDIPKTAMG